MYAHSWVSTIQGTSVHIVAFGSLKLEKDAERHWFGSAREAKAFVVSKEKEFAENCTAKTWANLLSK